jgi:hypothetical protein
MHAPRPSKPAIAVTAALAVVAALLVALPVVERTGNPVIDAGVGGFVGGVPLAVLARAIAEGDAPPPTENAEKAVPRQFEPFSVVETKVRLPAEPARLKCKWQPQAVHAGDSDSGEERSLGRFKSYTVVALDDESREIGAWTPSTKVTVWSATSAGTVMDRPPTFEPFEVHADRRNGGQAVHVVDGLVVGSASKADVSQGEADGTYYVAFLCQDGDEAAFLAETHGEAGRGLLCVLKVESGKWQPVGCQETWVA